MYARMLNVIISCPWRALQFAITRNSVCQIHPPSASLFDSLWDTVGSVEFVSEKSDDEAETAAPNTEADVAPPSTTEPQAEKTEATADATDIDRTLLMFQNSHLFELD